MNLIRATLILYRDCAVDASRGLGRSAMALVALFLATPLLYAVRLVFTGGGSAMLASFASGLLEAALTGWYLALVELAILGRGRVRLSDLTRSFGAYFWDVISVLFIFMIAGWVLLGLPRVHLVAVLAATLVFNPVPEMIYQEHSRSLGLLAQAARFMQEAWPEWIGVHLLAGGLLVGWGWLTTGQLTAGLAAQIIQFFGPWFQFIEVGSVALQLVASPGLRLLQATLLLVFVHWFMLYRGALYRRLHASTRRSRAWKARQ